MIKPHSESVGIGGASGDTIASAMNLALKLSVLISAAGAPPAVPDQY